jgi:hypothetical protein
MSVIAQALALGAGQLWVSPDAIERIVHQHPGLELRKIVGIHARQPERDGKQARRFGCEIETRGIGGADDGCKAIERLARKAELLDHHVKRAAFTAMAPEHVLDVERRRVEAFGYRLHLGCGDEKEHRVRIDHAADQPRARNAVDLRPRARHPDSTALRVRFRQLCMRNQRKLRLPPGHEATFQDLRRSTGVPEPGRCALTQLETFLTDHDGVVSLIACRPVRRVGVRSPQRAGNEPRVG